MTRMIPAIIIKTMIGTTIVTVELLLSVSVTFGFVGVDARVPSVQRAIKNEI